MFTAVVTALLLSSAPVAAQSMALEPQNRLHVGLNYVSGPSGLGVTAGFDSRLTRIIALDIGGFASPIPIGEDYEWTGSADAETPAYRQLRHGIYAAPGLRIPHAQPKSWAWDVFARAGGGVIWTANLSPDAPADTDSDYAIRPDPAGMVGADALVRFGRVGVRASGKVWMFDVLQTTPSANFFVVRPQWGIEALVQW
jgi:hypothetical protein